MKRPMRRSLTTAVCFVVIQAAVTGLGAAADERCALAVDHRPQDTLAYKWQGDRCEGRYVGRLSGEAIAVVSFTSAFHDFDLRSASPLTVEWEAPQGAETHLRGRALGPKVYYQMDTVRPAGDTMFRWPVDILGGVGIHRADLGVVGYYRGRIGNTDREILVPLKISQGAADTEDTGYELLVRPGVQLHEVYVSVAPVGDDGSVGNFLRDEEPLELGFYPAERAFPVTLPELPQPGVHYLAIAAEPVGSGTLVVEELYFVNRP